MPRLCEKEGCKAKLEFGKHPIYQRTGPEGKMILVCQNCADEMDGIHRDRSYNTGTEVSVEAD